MSSNTMNNSSTPVVTTLRDITNYQPLSMESVTVATTKTKENMEIEKKEKIITNSAVKLSQKGKKVIMASESKKGDKSGVDMTTECHKKDVGSSSISGISNGKAKGNSKGKGKKLIKTGETNPNSLINDMNDILSTNNEDIDLVGMPSWLISLMEIQPTLNIMTIGDVSHGKSTLMWGLCDEKTGRHSKEVKKNMTIKLGYTSCKIFKCIKCQNSNNICYFSTKSEISDKKLKCPKCGVKKPFIILVRHISFVDCPGHAEYMGTMISAACVADGAIMVIDASRAFPGKQTVQHTSAAHILGVLTDSKRYYNEMNNISSRIKVIVAQNKIDLISQQKACQNVTEIRSFLSNYDSYLSRNTPIIPISAQSKLNLDALCYYMVKKYPMFSPRLLCNDSLLLPPLGLDLGSNLGLLGNHSINEAKSNEIELNEMKENLALRINIIRSFDVNRPCDLRSIDDIDNKIHGGVLGGVIIEGTINIGDIVCIRPGIVKNIGNNLSSPNNNNNGKKMNKTKEKILKLLSPKFIYQPIECKVIGLKCGTKSLKIAYPGANVGIMLNIDPCLTKNDERAGDIICNSSLNLKDKLSLESKKYPVFNTFLMSFILLKPYNKIGFKLLEGIKVNIGSSLRNGFIVKRKINLPDKKGKGIIIVLEKPICSDISSKVTITRKIDGEWRLAASGIIFSVRQCKQACQITN